MKRILLVIFLIVMGVDLFYSQTTDLRSLSEQERTNYLINKAREGVLEYIPEWYRADIIPEVYFFGEAKNGDNPGRNLYMVSYKVDKVKEPDNWDFMSKVLIFEDTGELSCIFIGTGRGYTDFTNLPKVSEGKASETPRFIKRPGPPKVTIIDE